MISYIVELYIYRRAGVTLLFKFTGRPTEGSRVARLTSSDLVEAKWNETDPKRATVLLNS